MPLGLPVRRRPNRRAPEPFRPPVTPHRPPPSQQLRPHRPLPPMHRDLTAVTAEPPLSRTTHRITLPPLELDPLQNPAVPDVAPAAAQARRHTAGTAATAPAPGARARCNSPSMPAPGTPNRSDAAAQGLRLNPFPLASRPLRPTPGTSRPPTAPSPRSAVAVTTHRRHLGPTCLHAAVAVQSVRLLPSLARSLPALALCPTRFNARQRSSFTKRKRRPRAT